MAACPVLRNTKIETRSKWIFPIFLPRASAPPATITTTTIRTFIIVLCKLGPKHASRTSQSLSSTSSPRVPETFTSRWYNNLINCHIDHAYQCNNCTDWNIPTANMCPFWCITSIDTHPSLFVHLLCESMWWNIQFIIIHSNVVTVLSCLRTYLHVLVRVSNNTWESKNSIYLYKLNYWQESGNRSAHRATEKFRIRSEAKYINHQNALLVSN